jgi:hypothetical protein
MLGTRILDYLRGMLRFAAISAVPSPSARCCNTSISVAFSGLHKTILLSFVTLTFSPTRLDCEAECAGITKGRARGLFASFRNANLASNPALQK